MAISVEEGAAAVASLVDGAVESGAALTEVRSYALLDCGGGEGEDTFNLLLVGRAGEGVGRTVLRLSPDDVSDLIEHLVAASLARVTHVASGHRVFPGTEF